MVKFSCQKEKSAIDVNHYLNMRKGYTYILSNKMKNVLYIGVTGNIDGRIIQHKNDEGCNFARKYKCKYLLYCEEFENMIDAMKREKQLKRWHREWKWNLIKSANPDLVDLRADLDGVKLR